MLDETFSCVNHVNKTVHIALPSAFVSNEIAGVSEILESWKRQYIQQLNGVVVGYKNVSLTSNAGYVISDKPFVHYDVKAIFSLFCPSIGSLVKGTINRISREHIGCLVLNTINVTIHVTEDIPSEFSKFVALDKEIIFQISHFDFHRKVIRVKGKITPECIQILQTLYPDSTLSENELVSGDKTRSTKNKHSKKSRTDKKRRLSNDSVDLFSSNESTISDSQLNFSSLAFSNTNDVQQSQCTNPLETFDENNSNFEIKKEPVKLMNNVDETVKKTKKKKKQKNKDSSSQLSMSETSEAESHKKKKKKTKITSSENADYFPPVNLKQELKSDTNASEESLPETVIANYSTKNKKKQESFLSQEYALEAFQNEKSPKKKKKKLDSFSFQQNTFELLSSESVPKKKKQKRESSFSQESTSELLPSENMQKKRKRKRESLSQESTTELLPSEIVPKKKKPKQELSLPDEITSELFSSEKKKKEKRESSLSQESTSESLSLEKTQKKKRGKSEQQTSSTQNELELSPKKKKNHKKKINVHSNETQFSSTNLLPNEAGGSASKVRSPKETSHPKKEEKPDTSQLLELLASHELFKDSKESLNIESLESLLMQLKAGSTKHEPKEQSSKSPKKMPKDGSKISKKKRKSKNKLSVEKEKKSSKTDKKKSPKKKHLKNTDSKVKKKDKIKGVKGKKSKKNSKEKKHDKH